MKHLLILTLAAGLALAQGYRKEADAAALTLPHKITTTEANKCIGMNGPVDCPTPQQAIKDARNLKTGDMLVVELSPEDRAAFAALEESIAKAKQAIESKRQEILARHNAIGWSPQGDGLRQFTVCGPSIRFETEWRSGFLLITRLPGFDPCGTNVTLTPGNK